MVEQKKKENFKNGWKTLLMYRNIIYKYSNGTVILIDGLYTYIGKMYTEK